MRGFVLGFALALTLALGVAVADGPSGTPAPTPAPLYFTNTLLGPWGDANCDGALTSADALAILQALDGLQSSTANPWPGCGIGREYRVTIHQMLQDPIH